VERIVEPLTDWATPAGVVVHRERRDLGSYSQLQVSRQARGRCPGSVRGPPPGTPVGAGAQQHDVAGPDPHALAFLGGQQVRLGDLVRVLQPVHALQPCDVEQDPREISRSTALWNELRLAPWKLLTAAAGTLL